MRLSNKIVKIGYILEQLRNKKILQILYHISSQKKDSTKIPMSRLIRMTQLNSFGTNDYYKSLVETLKNY